VLGQPAGVVPITSIKSPVIRSDIVIVFRGPDCMLNPFSWNSKLEAVAEFAVKSMASPAHIDDPVAPPLLVNVTVGVS